MKHSYQKRGLQIKCFFVKPEMRTSTKSPNRLPWPFLRKQKDGEGEGRHQKDTTAKGCPRGTTMSPSPAFIHNRVSRDEL